MVYKKPKYIHEALRLLEDLRSDEPGSRTGSYGRNIGNAAREEAKRILGQNPLPQNKPCQTCFAVSDLLTPTQIKVCPRCADRFRRKTGLISFNVRRRTNLTPCDNCLKPTMIEILLNPFVCDNCLKKVGERHKRRGIAEYAIKLHSKSRLTQPRMHARRI